MSSFAPVAGLALLAAAAAPARAQDREPQRPPATATEDARRLERRTWRVVRKTAPAVLSVTVTTRTHDVPRVILPGLMLGAPGSTPQRIDATGILVTADGHIATTLAVVQNAAYLEVRMKDGRVYDAALVGVDEPLQMAVICTKRPENPQPLDEAGRMRATGEALGWFLHASQSTFRPEVQLATVKPATCSDTSYDRYLSAAVRFAPTAEGGPLVDADGRLLGMAVREMRGSSDAPGATTLFIQGADLARAAREIVRHGRVRRPMLGVVLDGTSNRVDQILPGSPAERVGLSEGDRVLAVAGEPVDGLAAITRTLVKQDVGQAIRVDIERAGKLLARRVVLTEMRLPPLPDRPPLPGATLELAADARTDAERVVTFTELQADSPLSRAGVRIGDRLLEADGRETMRFLSRHRIRPSSDLPSTLVIERDGQPVEIRLDD